MKNKIAAAVLASATVIRIGNAMATSHQLCAETSFFEKGNWYCKPVQLITYENVGRAGSYKEVVDMDQETGECRFAERAYGGPLAPFNEPMSIHFRGPLILKQFAVYLPNTGRYKVKRKRQQAKKLKKRGEESEDESFSASASSSSSDPSSDETGDEEEEDEDGYVYQYQDYIALYEHAEEEKRAYFENSSRSSEEELSASDDDDEEYGDESDGHLSSKRRRRKLRRGIIRRRRRHSGGGGSKEEYTSAPIKDQEHQGRIKKGTTLTQLHDGSVGFWQDPDDDRVILQATSEEFDFLWENVHKLSLKVPVPLPSPFPQGAGPAEEPAPKLAPVPEPAAPKPEEDSLLSGTGAGFRQYIPSNKISPEPVAVVPEATPSINPTLEDHNPPNVPFSAVHTPKLKNTPLSRSAYYNADAQRSEGLTFLGNYGGQGSGRWTPTFGNTLSYINAAGTGGSQRSEVLSNNITIPSGKEFGIFSSQPCSSFSSGDVAGAESSCGYIQPGSIAYRGFGHAETADKLFLMEFSMPHDGSYTGRAETDHFQADMPAIWMLNARIPYTAQYHACSCWASGCGEFDIVEVLDPGNDKAKTTFHSVFGGGDGNYFARPVRDSVTVAVVFDGEAGAVSVKVLNGHGNGSESSQSKEFPTWLSVDEIKRYWQEDVGLYGAGGSSAYRIP